jgi:hypothetical protein
MNFDTYLEIAVEVTYKWDQDSLVLVSATVNDSPVCSDILPFLSEAQRAGLEDECQEHFKRQLKEN